MDWWSIEIASTTPNSDLDWDVITTTGNKGWDENIKAALVSNGFEGTEEYIVDDFAALKDYLRVNNDSIDVAIAETDYYFVKTKNGKYYHYRRTNTDPDYSNLVGQWFEARQPSGNADWNNDVYDLQGNLAKNKNGGQGWLGLSYNAVINRFNEPINN